MKTNENLLYSIGNSTQCSAALIHEFIQRAHIEPDASRCLTYMECIRTAAEAKTMLVRHR